MWVSSNAQPDEVGDRILDATLSRILQVGVRRASLDDIARDANVNRVTIYRRFATKENLVDAVLARQVAGIVSDIRRITTPLSDIDSQIEETMVHVLRQTRIHPLVTQLLDTAPDEVVAFYTVRGRQLVNFGIHTITEQLGRAQQAGTIDRYDPRPVAELLARLTHSVLLTPHGGFDFEDEHQTHMFVRTSIVPMVIHGIPASR